MLIRYVIYLFKDSSSVLWISCMKIFLSKNAKWVSFLHKIEAALGSSLIKANSPKDWLLFK